MTLCAQVNIMSDIFDQFELGQGAARAMRMVNIASANVRPPAQRRRAYAHCALPTARDVTTTVEKNKTLWRVILHLRIPGTISSGGYPE